MKLGFRYVFRLEQSERGSSQAPRCASEGEVIFDLNANEVSRRGESGASKNASQCPGLNGELVLRCPKAEDGPAVTALIAASPPLDTNSAYCNLLQCTDFADTCVVAERAGKVIGWISAYRPPSQLDAIFVWQVAVDPSARGERLGSRMLDELLARPATPRATTLTTTITERNSASWGLFTGFAHRHGALLTKSPRFERDAHFAGAHDTEWQASIGPLPSAQT